MRRFRRRLTDEARTMAALNHPNVLGVFDIGSLGPQAYIVMDLAAGSLADEAEKRDISRGDAVSWTLQVLSGLAAAHRAGVVHRDVKPRNILLDHAGNALLADFGIALLSGGKRHTRAGVAMGSMVFMAPEQRLDASTVDHRADLYAVGATLYNLLTDQNPMDLFMEGLDSPRLAGLPPRLALVIHRATRHHPNERYPDAERMAAALMAALPQALDTPVPTGDAAGLSPTASNTRRAMTMMGEDYSPTVVGTEVVQPSRLPTANASSVAPLPPDEAERLQALLSLAVLDTEPEERFERHTRMAQRLFDAPIALVSLVDHKRQWFKSHLGLDVSETPRELAFCAHAILEPDRVFEIPDATLDPRFADSPLVQGDPNIRFYAGCPVKGPDDLPMGTLCIIDRKPRTLDATERRLLRDLATMVEAELSGVLLSTTDSLTGLCNREGLLSAARFALRVAEATGRHATLLQIQLSGLTQLTESSGSNAQDDARRAFSTVLRRAWQAPLSIARIDDNTFCALLPGHVSEEQAFAQLDAAVSRAPLPSVLRFRMVRVSFDPGQNLPLAALMAEGEEGMWLKGAHDTGVG